MFIIAFMPFAVAFITNAGSSDADAYVDSMESNAVSGPTTPGSYWLENGGDNLTSDYSTLQPNLPDQFLNCAVVKDGWCRGTQDEGVQRYWTGTSSFAVDWRIPASSVLLWQSHYYAAPVGQYLGASGDEAFGWRFSSAYFPNLPQNDAIDRLRFTFVNHNVQYTCSYSEFTDMTFNGDISFNFNGETKTFGDFEFTKSNKFEHRFWDNQHAEFKTACQVGFSVEFDFTGFESLSLQTFNGGDWENTTIDVMLTDFERIDGRTFADTPLPFAGGDRFAMSIEHQPVNSATAGFIIRTGTLLLSGLTFAVGIASTRQWNPFKTFIGGLLP